MNYRNIGKSCT